MAFLSMPHAVLNFSCRMSKIVKRRGPSREHSDGKGHPVRNLAQWRCRLREIHVFDQCPEARVRFHGVEKMQCVKEQRYRNSRVAGFFKRL